MPYSMPASADLCRSTVATHVPEHIYCTCFSLDSDTIFTFSRYLLSINGNNIVASIILLCHNLAPKDARPVNYFIQYAGLILETIHIKPD